MLNRGGNKSIRDSREFLWIYANARGTNEEAWELDLGLVEDVLTEVCIKASVRETLEDFPDVDIMISLIAREWLALTWVWRTNCGAEMGDWRQEPIRNMCFPRRRKSGGPKKEVHSRECRENGRRQWVYQ